MVPLQRVTVFCLVVTLALVAGRLIAAEDPAAKTPPQSTTREQTPPAKSKEETDKSEALEAMRERARRMLVQVGATPDSPKPELKEQPLIHYSDRVRQLPESTLWAWEQRGVPVLFCKIERMTSGAGGGRQVAILLRAGDDREGRRHLGAKLPLAGPRNVFPLVASARRAPAPRHAAPEIDADESHRP